MANEIKRRLVRDVPKRGPRRLTQQEWKLAEAIRADENVELLFDQPLVFSPVNAVGSLVDTSAEVAAGERHLASCAGVPLEYYVAGTDSTGTAVRTYPYVSADGLELNLDDDAVDGVTKLEICPSILSTAKVARVVGTDDDFMMEAKMKIDDISDITEIFVGFRTAEAFQNDPDDYNNMAAFHIATHATAGVMKTATIDDNAATSYSSALSQTWADGAEKTLRIIVRRDRSVEWYIDGVRVAGTTHSMDAADVVVPFIHVNNSAGTGGNGDPGVSLTHLKVGFV